VLDVAVSFEKKQAVVRFEIGKVRLEQILKRYAATPFDVTPAGPVTTIVRHERATVRAWADPAKLINITSEGQEAPPGAIVVEFVPAAVHRFAEPPSVSPARNLSEQKLKLVREVTEVSAADAKPPLGPGAFRFTFAVRPEGHIEPGQVALTTEFRYTALDPDGKRNDGEGNVAVMLEAVSSLVQSRRASGSTGVALVGGSLELGLGHLCDQTGCVEHLHKSLEALPAVLGVRPQPSLNEPRASLFLEAGQPIDVWGLREKLRDRGIEVRQMVARDVGRFACQVELSRWHEADGAERPTQCQQCRDGAIAAMRSLAWTSEASFAGAGVTVRTRETAPDLCTPLDKLEGIGIAPRAVWLVPDGIAVPKASQARMVVNDLGPKTFGSDAHPLIQFDFGHACTDGEWLLQTLWHEEWTSRTGFAGANLGAIDQSRVLHGATGVAAINDRQRADLSPLLRTLRGNGKSPTRIRLSEFGDLRIQFEFAHLCGDIEFSKPPKKEQKKTKETKADEKKPDQNKPADNDRKTETGESASAQAGSGTAEAQGAPKQESPKADNKEADKKDEKPFVPRPLRPAETSNARKAIERAIASVKWVEQGTYLEYHTKPEFDAPTKLTITLRPAGDGVVRLDELTRAIAQAGFPPTAVRVSRLFPGIPFGHALPVDLDLETAAGEKRTLASYHKPGRPLAVAFVSLYCPKWDKYPYDANAKFFEKLKQSIESLQDRMDFVAVSSNPDDKAIEVAELLEKANVRIPLLNDPAERARAAFNAQVTPPPHLFIFDGDGRLRYAGDPHANWNKPDDEQKDFLGPAVELVLAGKFADNGAVSFNSPKCNCSSPNCKCPKCGCGPSCRCDIGH
jgi:hypothetical protein